MGVGFRKSMEEHELERLVMGSIFHRETLETQIESEVDRL